MYSKLKIKNSLCALDLLITDNTQIYKDSNKIKIIQKPRKRASILNPDKSNGVVIINIKDYTNSVEHLFKDPKKFQILDSNPSITRKKSFQNYLRTLTQRNEITKAEFDLVRPKNGKPDRVHGHSKTYKEVLNIPKFRPIIDTTRTIHIVL